jgi:hypothetical protein
MICRGKPKNTGKKQLQCHFVHQKSHLNYLELNPGFYGKEVEHRGLRYGTAHYELISNQI